MIEVMVFEKREIYFNFSMCTSTRARYLVLNILHIRELFNLVPGFWYQVPVPQYSREKKKKKK